ncbi:MAG: radical SAM protein [archaeon]
MKIFHYKEKLDSLPKSVKKIMPPIHIRIKPTNACNHNCSYCAYRAKQLQLGQDMQVRDQIPREKMMEIVEDLIEMGVKAVTFSGGGEPFCYPHLAEAAKGLADGGIRIASLTNGAKLEGKAAEVFARFGTWLRVSMDGWDDDSYSRFRGVPKGEFTKVIGNMQAFRSLGRKCYLSVCIIVGRDNAGHVAELVARLRKIGVDSVKIAPCIISNEGIENNKYHQPIFDTVRDQISEARKLENRAFQIFDSYHTQLDTFKKDYSWCPFLQILPIIGADLNIYPCQDKAYNLETGLLGSIAGQRFRQFWCSDKNSFFKINPARDCNHHCVANEKNRLILNYLDADPDHLGFV